MRFLAALFLWVALSNAAAARDLYVDNVEGDDSRSGTAAAYGGQDIGPFRTIARALRAARYGDRIILAKTKEPYRESISLQGFRNSGALDHPFTIEGNGAVLDGSRPVAPARWENVEGEIFRFLPERTGHQQLLLKDQPLPRRRGLGGPGSLKPMEWMLHEGRIYIRVEKDLTPAAYALSYGGLTVGVTLYKVRGVLIRNLTLQGFQLDGVNAHDGAVDVRLVQLTCRGNGRSGVSIGGASRVEIEACLVGNNGAAQIRTEGYSQTRLVKCDLLDNTAPALVQTGHSRVQRQDAEIPPAK